MANTISGTTTLNDTPTQARVSLVNTDTNLIVSSQLSDAVTGAFEFTGLPAGTYEIITFIDGYKPRVDGPWVMTSANVVSLLHFDGADGSTTFVDEKGVLWTPAGSAQIDTSQSVFGGSSLILNGVDAWLDAADARFAFGTADFTIEAQSRWDALSGNQFVWGHHANWGVYAYKTTEVRLAVFNGTANVIQSSVGAVADDTWYHVALSRASGTLRLFLNGILQGSVADATDFNTTNFRLGAQTTGSGKLNGHIDEFRITKGFARYTADFTPPTAPYPND